MSHRALTGHGRDAGRSRAAPVRRWWRYGLVVTALLAGLTTPSTGTYAAWQAAVTNTGSFTTAAAFTTALRSWGWGLNGRTGVLLTPIQATTAVRAIGEETWASVAAGDMSTCAITTAGALYCWGDNSYSNLGTGDTTNYPEPIRIGTESTWSSVKKGFINTCAIKNDQSLWCWGYNVDGQIGNNTSGSPVTTPTAVTTTGVTTWSSVSLGRYFACGTKTDRTLWCWGYNASGRLGNGNTTSQSVPVQVGSATWASVEAGTQSSCAVKYVDSTLWCWGYGGLGQLGNGATTDQSAPVAVSGGGTWTASSQGYDRGCGIRTGGTMWCWGYGGYGDLGRGSTTDSSVPVQEATGATDWASLSAMSYGTCGTTTGSTLRCWGQNSLGELGDGSTTDRSVPVASGSSTTWTQISGGDDFTCGVRTDQAIWCQGYDAQGQLGHDHNDKAGAPTPLLAPNASWTTGAAGYEGGCGIQTTGTMWCWGLNTDGQVGVGDTAQHDYPLQAGTATTWAKVSMGTWTTCAVRTDNSLWCWGKYSFGQLGVAGAAADATTPAPGPAGTWSSVSVGETHTCGITTAGALSCWGANGSGQLGTGNTTNSTTPQSVTVAGVTTWASVSAGYYATCAIAATGLNAGALYCWGQNTQGQVGNGTTLNPQSTPLRVGLATWSTVVTARENACGIQTAGSLWCWGYNNYGQSGNGLAAGTPANLTTPTQVGTVTTWSTLAAGWGFGCAGRTDRSVWCWGRDDNGELGDRNGGTTRTTPQRVPGLSASWLDAHTSTRITLAR